MILTASSVRMTGPRRSETGARLGRLPRVAAWTTRPAGTWTGSPTAQSPRCTSDEARRLRHNYVGTEHLLLGLAREGGGMAGKVLSDLGIDLAEVRRTVESVVGEGDRFLAHVAPREIGLTPRAQTALRLAVDEARRLEQDRIGT